MVLHEQPPPVSTEAKWVPTKARIMVEHRAHHARRPPAARATGEGEGPEERQTEGETCGLKGAAADGTRPSRLQVHRSHKILLDVG
jgi:hypothetical protein